MAQAIKLLKVRGAPLIGVAAAYGLALAISNYHDSQGDIDKYYYDAENLLVATRPTAVNLVWAVKRMRQVFQLYHQQPLSVLVGHLWQEAHNILREDVETNETIGEYGQDLLADDARVLTICNAGALATCGYGTALGVIRSAHQRRKISQVWACETRPVLQGARLTIWELMQDKIPVTLITDNMAGYVMQQGNVDAVIVGADRVAANGDTANKIGTYSLAVLARHHEIPFYVAAPISTIDVSIAVGQDIPIEERNQDEVRQVHGRYITVPDVKVYNPAFDVTPAELISAIITEKGVITPTYPEGIKMILRKDA
jgi:methylthioribose-1-phosphate isomerase